MAGFFEATTKGASSGAQKLAKGIGAASQAVGTIAQISSASAQRKAQEEALRKQGGFSMGGQSVQMQPAGQIRMPQAQSQIQSFKPRGGQNLAQVLAALSRGK